jgi:PAS domain S-box-containing protein
MAISENAASLLLSASDEILLLLDAETLEILALNPAALTRLGYAEGDLIGRPIGDFECALSDMFFWDEMRGRDWVIGVESALRCADGHVMDVAKSVRRVSLDPPRYAVRALPVAGHNRIEAELATMGSRLRATLEATADGILLLDQQGAIINMNQRFSAMWNLPESLLVNRDDEGIMSFMAAQVIAGVDGEIGGDPGTNAETADDGVETKYLADGRVFECRVHDAHSGEEIIGRVYSYRDITERYRTQRELITARDEARRASRAKGEFLAMMSHEIRTPMNGVLGIAELLAATPLDAEQADYLRVIRSSGETLLAIINDILDYSKIEAGRLSLENTDFSLPALVDEIAALFKLRQKPGGPVFVTRIAPDVPAHLSGDPVRLRQILFNLIGNAFKFTERGEIRLEVDLAPTADETQVVLAIAVHDTGIGLTEEQCARLFRSFEQADSSTTRKYGGTGLGLAICKSLVELMGGAIGVTSAAGVGSCFHFRVHLRRGAAVATPSQAVEAAQPLHAGLRILLVEDNPVNRKVIGGMLKRLGAGETALAGNGEEALAQVATGEFDLILMDTQMPVMDGITATRELRACGVSTPIVGVSAGALEEERRAALDAGMDDYVLKPVHLDALRAALNRVLAAPGHG